LGSGIILSKGDKSDLELLVSWVYDDEGMVASQSGKTNV
jgi:hypothetical protein